VSVHKTCRFANCLPLAIIIGLVWVLTVISPGSTYAQICPAEHSLPASHGARLRQGTPGALPSAAHRELEILIYDHAGVAGRVRDRAEDEATYILGRAGVQADWLVCFDVAGPAEVQDGCRKRTDSEHICILIESHAVAQPVRTLAFAPLTLGIQGEYATILYDRILRLADSPGTSLSVVLGCVIAHEIGHVLLGANSHSPEGVMSAAWSQHDLTRAGQRRLGFSQDESCRLQAAVMERDRAEVVSAVSAMNRRR